jgi:hypothetical protein
VLALIAPMAEEGGDDEGGGSETDSALIIESAVTTIPSSCTTPDSLRSVFVGRVASIEANFVLYSVESERFGTVADLLRNSVLTVRYPIDDVKYLAEGERFLVGAIAAPSGIRGDTPVLESKVRVPPDMFGGDAVAAEQRISCPDYEDPVRTLRVNGDAIDTGLLRPLLDDRSGLLRALLLPVGIGLAVLFLLAATRVLVTGAIRGMRQSRRRGSR